jgi:hypothetical protein
MTCRGLKSPRSHADDRRQASNAPPKSVFATPTARRLSRTGCVYRGAVVASLQLSLVHFGCVKMRIALLCDFPLYETGMLYSCRLVTSSAPVVIQCAASSRLRIPRPDSNTQSRHEPSIGNMFAIKMATFPFASTPDKLFLHLRLLYYA